MLIMKDLNEAKARAAINRSRLVFVPTSLQQDFDASAVNLNEALSEQLINLPKADRARSVAGLISNLVNQAETDEVFIAGLEVLFDRTLAIDPLKLLEACSKNKTLLVCWPGDRTDKGLSYALPSHPEYRNYKESDLGDVIYLDIDAQIH